jgi:hypothetical protein
LLARPAQNRGMAFRDETDALRSQRDALEKERDELQHKVEVLTSSPLGREHLDRETRLRAAERDLHHLTTRSNRLESQLHLLVALAFMCFALLVIAAFALAANIALDGEPERLVAEPAPPRRPPPARPAPPPRPEPPPAIEPPPPREPRPPEPAPPAPDEPPFEATELAWDARVIASDHPEARRGTRCRVSAHVVVDRTDFDLVDWDASVRCGDTVLYDSSLPFSGSSSTGASLAIHPASGDRPETIDLSARDVGDRTGRPQLYLDTQARAARVVFSDVLVSEVRLTVTPGATPSWRPHD